MNLNDILSNISTRLNISRLNRMQQAITTDESPEVTLIAPTGSGKTIAFAIYMLRHINDTTPGIKALVIAPTRELTLQITGVLKAAAAPLKVTPLYGGHSMEDEKNSLKQAPDIVIATPGRLTDHINRKQIDLDTITVLVIDEYDKCLDLGFEPQIKKITARLNHITNTIFTSATPITPQKKHSQAELLSVVRVQSPTRDKADTLIDLIRSIPEKKIIIFVNHRESAERLHSIVKKAGDTTGLYHGGLDQHDREIAVELLKNGTTPILIATDLAARGLDIEGVDAVVHYHLPTSAEAWTHRNGRTARNGASGTAYVITSDADDIPPYIKIQRDYAPHLNLPPKTSETSTLYFSAGKKEKISRGDIVGFLLAHSELSSSEITGICVADHHALAAVPSAKIKSILNAVSPFKLKNKKVKVSIIRP